MWYRSFSRCVLDTFFNFVWRLPCRLALAHWPNFYCSFIVYFTIIYCSCQWSWCCTKVRQISRFLGSRGRLPAGWRIVSVPPISVVDAGRVYSRLMSYELNSLYSVTLYFREPSFMLYMYRANRFSQWYFWIWQGRQM